MQAAGALRISADAEALAADIADLLGDAEARATMAQAGRALVEQGRGALRRTLALVTPDLPAST
jgi:3-deoxy-D-manno-octulosonic-acid transferase